MVRRLTVDLPDEVYAQLQRDAAQEGRTVHGQARHLLSGGKPPRRTGGRKPAATAEQIVALLAAANRPVSTQEMARHFDCVAETLSWPLRDLVRDARVTRRYRRYQGYFYSLPDSE